MMYCAIVLLVIGWSWFFSFFAIWFSNAYINPQVPMAILVHLLIFTVNFTWSNCFFIFFIFGVVCVCVRVCLCQPETLLEFQQMNGEFLLKMENFFFIYKYDVMYRKKIAPEIIFSGEINFWVFLFWELLL